MFGSKTVKDVLDANRGAGPGFDVLRILLAGVIFLGHAKWLAGIPGYDPLHVSQATMLNHGGWEGWKRGIQESFVPAFFALSGFLVTGSALKVRVTSTFIAHRALRIFPALIVETTLSAILLGLFVTTLTPAAYFSSPETFRYMGNMVGWITFHLPGVFTSNPAPGVVNANLWTLPSEGACYAVAALLMASGILYRRNLVTVLFLIVSVAFAILNGFTDFSVTATTMAPCAVTYYFVIGAIFFHWREKLPVSWPLFIVSGVIGYLLQSGHHMIYLAAPFVTYCTVMFGMLPIPKLKVLASGDYSYGIYLYGFPITQAVVWAFPVLRGHPWGVFAVAGLLTCAFAAFSWHVIEKHALAMKKHLPTKWFPSSRPQQLASA